MTPTKLTPRPDQEESIVRILAEPTKAALIADETGFGKTLIASEVVVRAGWQRVLFIGIGATFQQWKDRLEAQSDGRIQLRRLDSTKSGREAFDAFLAGAPGHYFATIQWLTQQDVVYRDKVDLRGKPVWKVKKSTGEIILKDRPVAEWKPIGPARWVPNYESERGPVGGSIQRTEVAWKSDSIGPAQEPVRERQRVRLDTFRKMSARKSGPVDAIIFDESHAIANRDSQGRKTLVSIATEWKIAMSATWAGNSFEFAWSTTKWLWPDLIPAYWTWHEQWCHMRPKLDENGKPVRRKGGMVVQELVGEKEPEGAFVRSLPLYLRRERPEKAPEPIVVVVDATPEQRAQYEDLKEDLLTWAMNFEGDHEPLVVDIPAVLRMRLRQVALAELSLGADGDVVFAPTAASAKLRALKGVIDYWGDQPVVLMTDSEKFARLTAERMTAAGYKAEAWTGKTSEKERARIKASFLAGEFKYLVMTVQSGGTGVDGLQTVCSKIIWLSVPDGDPKLEEQALGRVFRPGMTEKYGPFEQVRLLMRDSVDVDVLENLIAKGRAIRGSIGAAALAQ